MVSTTITTESTTTSDKSSPAPAPHPAPPAPHPAPPKPAQDWTCVINTSGGEPKEICYSPGDRFQTCLNVCLLDEKPTKPSYSKQISCNGKEIVVTCDLPT